MKLGWNQVDHSTEGGHHSREPVARGADGFSLIELLIVAALLIILTTMYWGSSSGSRQRQLQKTCQQNLQKIFMAMDVYANEHGTKFPDVAGARTAEQPLDALIPRYTVDTSVFICPGSKDAPLPAGESILKHKISYSYFQGHRAADGSAALMSDHQVDALPKTAGQIAFSDTGKPPGNNHYNFGGNFLFGDGHVDLSPPRLTFSLVLTQGVVLLNP
jgi:prepilin-type processing-associated H-X9-DG protein